MLLEKSQVNEVHGISVEEKRRIMDYLQGAVYSWSKNRKGEWFAARDLLGGDNFYWEGTPMYILYGKSKDVEQAGKDAGWLLKKVINEDKPAFDTRKPGRVREYCWNGIEDNK
jgi:hypothetical protein